MLDAFISANHVTIIARTRKRVSSRTGPGSTAAELPDGIPAFLDQLVVALRLSDRTDEIDHAQISESATRHGSDLLGKGLSIEQVVHDYGDVCQVVTELAIEQEALVPTAEFRVLNLCLDDAIAAAVAEFSRHRYRRLADQGTERLGILAHESRNLVASISLAFETIKTGLVPVGGSTSVVLTRNLLDLKHLIDRSLADVRLDAGVERLERIVVADLLAEVGLSAGLQAEACGLGFTIAPVDPGVAIEGDRQTLMAAVNNLLQNAFKFTRKHGNVSLTTRVTIDHVSFDVEDECGGLPPGDPEALFRTFEQRGADRSGIGLGLAICRKAAMASHGGVHVRDLPGKGCIFTLDLPRRPPDRAAA